MAKELILALGGGGIRGIAHLGVIRCLEDHGYTISGIAGTSAGGLIGALYASGAQPEELNQVIHEFSKKPDFRRGHNDRASLIGTSGLEKHLDSLLGGRNIEDLPLPFVATAVDITTGKEIVIADGNLKEAVLTTIAIPGIFPSRERNESLLVDGGIVDPVPVRAARSLNPALPIVAVALHHKPENYSPESSRLPFTELVPDSLASQLSKLRLVEAFQVFYTSIDVLTSQLTEMNIIIDQPDLVVNPLVGHYHVLDLVIPGDLEERGYEAMRSKLADLEKAYSFFNTFKRINKYTVSGKKR
ncbi:MAG: patatin-like phospholipase family protein [Anaerolineaceae bacterium]